jgi:hypoxanthine phosphoribosyltransferase
VKDALGSRKPKAPAVPRWRDRRQAPLRVIYTEQQLRRRVRGLADQINRAYHRKTLDIVGAADDCFFFMIDFVRTLVMPVVCHFVTAWMYDARLGDASVREIQYSPALDLAGKDVLLMQCLISTGVTLDFLYRHILAQGPRSLRTVALIEKPEERKIDVATDYLAFKLTGMEGHFLVGYGMGYQGLYCNLPCVAALPVGEAGGPLKVDRTWGASSGSPR